VTVSVSSEAEKRERNRGGNLVPLIEEEQGPQRGALGRSGIWPSVDSSVAKRD